MRTLLLLRGAPGCGKSTFIKENGLEPYTVSSDVVRMLYSSPDLRVDGTYGISQKQDGDVWKTINSILESRFERGEFTVLDSTNSKTEDMRKLRALAEKYRYRIFLIDMTGVPIEIALRQNKLREPEKIVPEYAIKNIYERFKTEKVPSGIEVIKPDELSKVFIKQENLSNYKKIVHFGDIHGCYSTLMKYFEENPMNDETYYIFVGDYLDRGNENVETYKFIESIKDLPNVCLLEGNHERWINFYGNGMETKSDEFNDRTRVQLEEAGITQKSARQLYRKFRQMAYYTFKAGSKTYSVFVCHGGIPSIGTYQNREKCITCTPTYSMIHGVGSYPEYKDIAAYWMTNTANDYLIHGHRNTENDDIEIADRVFNLEGGVEFGGELRIVELDSKGFHPISIRSCQPIKEGDFTEKIDPEKISIEEAITILRNNRFIKESKLGNDVSSFNFSKAAFYEANWNKQTVIARGLFIDTKNKKIIARSYEKFFRINETTQTMESNLEKNLQFPVDVYEKENGFLGMISYDYRTDDLFIASKSKNSGEYVDYFKKVLEKYDTEKIKNYLKEHQEYTMVFEVIDPVNDPHIIEYSEPKIVLLNLIKNTLKFEMAPYCVVNMVGELCGIEVKHYLKTAHNWDELYNYIKTLTKDYKEQFEGIVVEDSSGFMFKVKTKFYTDIKKLRGVACAVYTYGKYMHENKLSEFEKEFVAECYKYYRDGGEINPNDIVRLLKHFNLYSHYTGE